MTKEEGCRHGYIKNSCTQCHDDNVLEVLRSRSDLRTNAMEFIIFEIAKRRRRIRTATLHHERRYHRGALKAYNEVLKVLRGGK